MAKSYAVYWGFTSLIDDQLGRVLSALEAEGVMEDTIIIFLSDHGENLGAHGLWHKMVAYEESIRVPMIFRLPGKVAKNVRSDTSFSLIDIAPTLSGLCDLPAHDDWRGRDMSDVLAGDSVDLSDRALFALHRPLGEWMGTQPWRMIEHRLKKYIWHMGDEPELFDLASDPFETRNLAAKPEARDTSAELHARMIAIMRETNDPLLDEAMAASQRP